MLNRNIRFSRATAVLVLAVTCIGLAYTASPVVGPAAAAAERAEGRRDIDQLIKSLQAVDTSYTADNTAEAQAKFAEALSTWNRISPLISAREAREQQLLFDSLASQLKSSVPAPQIKATVTGMVDELNDDIAGELR
jgi:uridylate kinase